MLYVLDRLANELLLLNPELSHGGGERIKLTGSISDWMAAHNSPIAPVPNAPAESSGQETRQAFLTAPLIDRGGAIGVIEVHRGASDGYSRGDLAFVTFIGEQIGGALARARLMERSHIAARRMRSLATLTETISSAVSMEPILRAITQMLTEFPPPGGLYVILADDEKKDLTVNVVGCTVADHNDRTPICTEGSPIEEVMRQGRAIVIPNIHAETRYVYPELSCKSEFTSLLAVPMTSKGEPVGAITFYTRAPHVFSREEVVFATVAAGLAAIAIRNVRLLARARDRKHRLETRRKIERAKSIIQYKCQLTEQQAYLRLRDESRKLRRTMREVAEAVILADGLNRG